MLYMADYCNWFFFLSFSSLYEINLMESKPAAGFYRLTISATPKKADKRLLGTSGAFVSLYDTS